MAGVGADGSGGAPGESSRRATNLELFLDLVFVFAVTQIATTIEHHLTVGGVLQGLLVAFLVWWLWTQFAWTGTVVDLDGRGLAQLVIVVGIAPTLVMAAAIPRTLDGDAGAFGVSYVCAQAVALGLLGWNMRRTTHERRTFLSYGGLAGIAPVVVLAGALLESPMRWWLWGVAAALGVGGALATGRWQSGPGWAVDPGHFSERHSLFVIIALGEVLVGVGTVVVEQDLRAGEIAGLLASVALAGALWWTYFAFVPRVVEHSLARADGPQRSRVARDLCSFLHFPLVVGVILTAVVVHRVMEGPGVPLDAPHRWLGVAAVALFLGGLMGMHLRVSRGVAPERIVALVVVTLLALLIGPHLAAGWACVAIAAVLVATHLVTLAQLERRQRRGEIRARARSAS